MYFKDTQNKLHFVDKLEDTIYLPSDCLTISDTEAQDMQIQSNPVITKTTLELDTEKYLRRANAKPLLMAEMAAMNIGRLKSGTWTTAQLITLMADPEIKSLVSHMETLSFELAINVINALTNPLITPEIKATWISKLAAKL